ncbi:hypothetical protein FF2_009373 [Malus domestica]
MHTHDHDSSKQNSAADIPNSTPVNGNLWEFKDAFSETGAKHKLEEARTCTRRWLGVGIGVPCTCCCSKDSTWSSRVVFWSDSSIRRHTTSSKACRASEGN